MFLDLLRPNDLRKFRPELVQHIHQMSNDNDNESTCFIYISVDKQLELFIKLRTQNLGRGIILALQHLQLPAAHVHL
jgi:hypothetical protein